MDKNAQDHLVRGLLFLAIALALALVIAGLT